MTYDFRLVSSLSFLHCRHQHPLIKSNLQKKTQKIRNAHRKHLRNICSGRNVHKNRLTALLFVRTRAAKFLKLFFNNDNKKTQQKTRRKHDNSMKDVLTMAW